MFVTNHVLAGALIGRARAVRPVRPVRPVRSVCGAFGLGVVSHFVMDACPHWGVKGPSDGWSDEFLRVARIDGCAGLAAIAACGWLAPAGRSRWAVLAGMAGAALPDIDKPAQYFFGVNPIPAPIDRFHHWVQHESPRLMPLELGIAGVLALAVAAAARRPPLSSSRLLH